MGTLRWAWSASPFRSPANDDGPSLVGSNRGSEGSKRHLGMPNTYLSKMPYSSLGICAWPSLSNSRSHSFGSLIYTTACSATQLPIVFRWADAPLIAPVVPNPTSPQRNYASAVVSVRVLDSMGLFWCIRPPPAPLALASRRWSISLSFSRSAISLERHERAACVL